MGVLGPVDVCRSMYDYERVLPPRNVRSHFATPKGACDSCTSTFAHFMCHGRQNDYAKLIPWATPIYTPSTKDRIGPSTESLNARFSGHSKCSDWNLSYCSLLCTCPSCMGFYLHSWRHYRSSSWCDAASLQARVALFSLESRSGRRLAVS